MCLRILPQPTFNPLQPQKQKSTMQPSPQEEDEQGRLRLHLKLKKQIIQSEESSCKR
jgi:hypothetical protein